MTARLAPRFTPRLEPLTPVAVAVPRRLCAALLDRWRGDARAIASLQAVATPTTLLFFGDADALPWLDGVVYLGHDADAPRLLVPTAVAPDVPLALLERALFARFPGARPRAAVLLEPMRVVSAASPAPFDLGSLEAWLA